MQVTPSNWCYMTAPAEFLPGQDEQIRRGSTLILECQPFSTPQRLPHELVVLCMLADEASCPLLRNIPTSSVRAGPVAIANGNIKVSSRNGSRDETPSLQSRAFGTGI